MSDAEPLSGMSFPPLPGTKYSDRKNFFQTCTFLKIRKASTENPNYVNPDGTSLLTYSETLSIDRDIARAKMLDHELAKGWLVDDRGAVPVQQGIQPAVPTNGAPMTAGFVQPPAPQPVAQVQAPQFVPQQVATAAQAVAVAQQVVPSAPPQMAAPTEMPMTKARRAAPKFGSAVAPPPPGPAPVGNGAPVAFQVPAPPPGAAVMQQPVFQQPVAFQPAPVAPAPVQVVQQPVQAAPNTALGPLLDLGPVVARVDELGRGLSVISKDLDTQKNDFKTMVGNLSAQINETNKALASLQKTAEYLMVAAHHMYITNKPTADASAGKAADIRQFKEFLTTYLDPAANPQ